ncbi:hypothetical protein D3C72_1390820 [compost metagenome]
MAGVRGIGMGLLVLATMLGCGRTGLQEAPPATQTIAFTAVTTQAPTASVVVWNEGRTLRLNLTGQGFTPGGAYAIQPLTAYTAGTPPTIARADDGLPEAIPVLADGTVQLLTTFQTRGTDRRWVGFGVFLHPNGDIGDESSGQLVLFAPLAADTL